VCVSTTWRPHHQGHDGRGQKCSQCLMLQGACTPTVGRRNSKLDTKNKVEGDSDLKKRRPLVYYEVMRKMAIGIRKSQVLKV
jgi:hypothetical protein